MTAIVTGDASEGSGMHEEAEVRRLRAGHRRAQ
jgi:hypothetical protein